MELYDSTESVKLFLRGPLVGKSTYPNHGERVVVGQHLMQAASDVFLGWTHGRGGDRFYVQQLRGYENQIASRVVQSIRHVGLRHTLRLGRWLVLTPAPAIPR